jgi:DNA-binding transcriptional LysR family regulator
MSEFLDLRIADVLTVLAVARSGSVSVAAKERSVTPSQVSKAIKRVARIVGSDLFVRKGTAFALTEPGRERIGELAKIAELAQGLAGGHAAQRLNLAAPSFLCDAFASVTALAVAPRPLRAITLGQRSIEAHASDAIFDIALSAGPLALPPIWSSDPIGTVSQALFSTPRVRDALGTSPTAEDVSRLPFVFPVAVANGEAFAGDDGCPIPRDARARGHETDTIRGALELAAATDQIAFGPVLAAESWLARGTLVRIDIEGVTTESPLVLHVHGERVTRAVQRDLIEGLQRAANERERG